MQIFTKICDSIKNYVHHEKNIRIKRLEMCAPPAIKILFKAKKHNTIVLQ